MKLSEKWEKKIAETRRRDARNHRQLKAAGWTIVRIWEHQIEKHPKRCASRIIRALARIPDPENQPGNSDDNLAQESRDPGHDSA